MNKVIIKQYESFPFSEKEILRYARVKEISDEVAALMRSAIAESEDALSYKVCYIVCTLSICGDICDFGYFKTRSRALAKNLDGVSRVIIFAATVGVKMDRLITKYSSTSPSRALMLQAIGAERIEGVCDRFARDIELSLSCHTRPRFSPGYADLDIEVQKDIFSLLDTKKIGLSLNDSLLMSPTKSVTAFMGIEDEYEF